jgi:hypothetical protein
LAELGERARLDIALDSIVTIAQAAALKWACKSFG